MFEHVTAVFNVAYYTAKNKPFSDRGLLILVDKLGIEVKDYNNHMRCPEFVAHIAQVLRKNLNCELKQHKYVCC